MIEQIMFFVLGVLVATLVALMVLPAVWNRAVRLTTRRIEAAVPVSIFEIQAAKDQQRAQFALNQRRLELQIDALRETVSAGARMVEQHRLRILDVERDLAAKTAEHDALLVRFAAEEAALKERTETLALTATTLAAREAELATRTAELAETRATLERTRADLAAQTTRGDKLDATLAVREATISEQAGTITQLKADIAGLQADLAAARARIAELESGLAAEREAHAALRTTTEAERARLEADLAAERAAHAKALTTSDARAGVIVRLEREARDLSASLEAARVDLSATQSVARATEAQRAGEFAGAEAEARGLRDQLDMVRADHAMMEGALAKAREERDALAGREADLAVLRETLNDVAARVLGRVDGDAEPPPTTTAEAPANLADRIRAVRQEQAAAPAAAKVSATRRSAKR